MKTLEDLFDFWRPFGNLAAATGEHEWTVRKWFKRRRIPAKHWPAICLAMKERGKPITVQRLMQLHGKPAPAGDTRTSAVH